MNKFHLTLLNVKKTFDTLVDANLNKKIQNWPLLLADYLGRVKGNYTLLLKTPKGKLSLRAGSFDKWPVVEIILKDVYQLSMLDKTPSPTIVDLGAHIGVFSVFAALCFPKACVYALEPNERNFALLKKNIRLNNLQKRIFPFNQACASKEEKREFYYDSWKESGSLLSVGQIKKLVETTTLPTIFGKNKIRTCDFLKMDVEGAEYEIFYWLPKKTLKRVKRISLEYHILNKKTDLCGAALKKFLEKHGFRVRLKASIFDPTGYLYATDYSDRKA